jgi:hypothetical protein
MNSFTTNTPATTNGAPQRWWTVWLLAIAIAASAWYAFERYWRTQGYAPTVMDSTELWAQLRDRVVKPSPPLRVALLGASRIQYGISPSAFVDEAKRLGVSVDAAMLAVNGHYPLAALRDLAADERFTGLAIVGIDSRGLQKRHREMQSKWTYFYQHDWTPARDLHRSLLTNLQRHVIASRPDFAWSNLLTRRIDGYGPPHRDYVTFLEDRSGGTDYARGNIELVRAMRVRDLRDYYAKTPVISSEQWLKDNEDVIGWVKRINARGGRVVFYREPASGEHLELDETRFPRAQYWDAFARATPATVIEFRDVPALQVDTPDTSHIDAKDIDRHTRALVGVLVARDALKR